ncbi:ATP-binding protein [Thermodesulfobacteriota bacterium]
MNIIDDKLKLLQPVIGAIKVQKLRQLYFFSDDFRERKGIENHIDLLISRFVKKDIEDQVTLPPPDPQLCQGEIDAGELSYLNQPKGRLGLKLKDINRHVGIFGSTGSGKTTFAQNLLRQLHKRGIPFLIFDWEKSYRNLTKEFDDVQVFTVGKDINPLYLNFLTVPPGIAFDEYIKSIIAIISEDYIGGIGADTMLLNYMEMAFQETKNPFFEDLKQVVLREIQNDRGRGGKLAGRSGLWKETVSRQITFMSKGAAGQVVNPSRHYPLEKLFSKPIVLEFGNLKSPHDRKFFIHVILNWLSIYNQHYGMQSEKLKQVLLFEEFHNIVMKGKDDNMVSTLFRESRKYGIGLIAIDQTPSEIPNSIFANINTKVSFSLGTSRDIQAMAKAINLNHDKARFLGMLKTGEAIINIKQRHHDSFLIKPPFVPESGNVWDEELREAMKKFASENEQKGPQIPEPQTPQTSQDKDTSLLNALEKVLINNIIERPLDGVDKRTKRLGLHPSNIANLHSSLTEKGIIKTVGVDKKKLFEITPDGRILIEKAGIGIKKQDSRGGVEHTYWINQVLQSLRNLEFNPVTESGGIDITDATTGLAIEIETGKSDIKKNLTKLDQSHFPNQFMLATSKPVELKLKSSASTFPQIRIMFIKDFLKLTREQITSPIILTPQK